MKNFEYNDILKYAQKLKEAYPEISNEDLKKKALEAFLLEVETFSIFPTSE